MKRSMAWALASLFGVLIAATGHGALRYQDAHDRASRAAEQAEQVRLLAAQITDLTDRPTVATTQAEEVQQLSGLVEQTAGSCGIAPERIGRITAQDPRHVGQTPYYRLPTRVSLEGVELPQLVDLLHHLTDGGRLLLEECRLAAPHGEVVGKTWNAEFTLAYLVYDPRQDQDPR